MISFIQHYHALERSREQGLGLTHAIDAIVKHSLLGGYADAICTD